MDQLVSKICTYDVNIIDKFLEQYPRYKPIKDTIRQNVIKAFKMIDEDPSVLKAYGIESTILTKRFLKKGGDLMIINKILEHIVMDLTDKIEAYEAELNKTNEGKRLIQSERERLAKKFSLVAFNNDGNTLSVFRHDALEQTLLTAGKHLTKGTTILENKDLRDVRDKAIENGGKNIRVNDIKSAIIIKK